MDEKMILHLYGSGDFLSFIDGFSSYTRENKAFREED